jgi:hypothetical protein
MRTVSHYLNNAKNPRALASTELWTSASIEKLKSLEVAMPLLTQPPLITHLNNISIAILRSTALAPQSNTQSTIKVPNTVDLGIPTTLELIGSTNMKAHLKNADTEILTLHHRVTN